MHMHTQDCVCVSAQPKHAHTRPLRTSLMSSKYTVLGQLLILGILPEFFLLVDNCILTVYSSCTYRVRKNQLSWIPSSKKQNPQIPHPLFLPRGSCTSLPARHSLPTPAALSCATALTGQSV